MIEVEIKVRILEPNEMRKRFEDNGGLYKISLLHEDTYFNMPNGLRDFRASDEALRIRKSIGFNKRIQDSERVIKYFITYKGQKIDTETKTRSELESTITDGEVLIEILKILGFQEIFTVKKERELYEFTFKNLKIEALIDYVPILKEHFIEVEYVADSNDNIDDARQILFDFLNQFDIKKDESIKESYLELIAERFRKKRKK